MRQVVSCFSPYSRPSLPRQLAVVPESQSTQNSINEQENAGMSLLKKHLVSEFSRTGKAMFEDLIFVFVILSGKGSELLACVILAIRGGKVCLLFLDFGQIVLSLFLVCENFSI